MNPNPLPRLPSSALHLNPHLNLPRASCGAAFTLVELLVATAITSLLILGMTGVFDQSMKAWRLSSRRADAEREVRAALSQIERDLSCLVVNSNTPIYLNISATNRVSIPNPFRLNMPPNSGPLGQDWVNVSQTLFFATADRSRTNQQGDLASVGYFVAWDTNSNGTNGLEKNDLTVTVPVDLYTALLGGEVQVPTLERPVVLTIPSGTQSGKRFRLRGLGMPGVKSGDSRGDLYAEISVELPTSLSPKERQLVEQLRELRQNSR